jgi:hypothetical protein
MFTIAQIAAVIDAVRTHALPGREAVAITEADVSAAGAEQ